jgi:MFS transporter, ACS family, hexuronate transporter
VMFAAGSAITGIFPIVMGTIPAESVRPELVGTVLGIGMGVGEAIGGTLGPVCAGLAADAFGMHATLWIMAALAVATASLGLCVQETAPVRRGPATMHQPEMSL